MAAIDATSEREPLLLSGVSNEILNTIPAFYTDRERDADLLSSEPVPGLDPDSNLRRVADHVSLGAYCVILTELFERAALMGIGAPFQNYLANPLPPGGNRAGAPAHSKDGHVFPPGALGLKQSLATASVMGFEVRDLRYRYGFSD